MAPVEQYLTQLVNLRHTEAGTGELSYYTPLINLINEAGRSLKPKVEAIGNLADVGAGHPDAGLFTEKQSGGQLPERGVVEVKGTAADVYATAHSEQVSRYLQLYRQVLVTNYWAFVLVGLDQARQPILLEAFQLAENEADFWRQAAHPHQLARLRGEQLVEYLKRVLLRPAALGRPQDVAWFLASYARDALARLSVEALPGLDTLRAALEEALGLTFQGEKGERFFRSTLVQTLFYGIFSAWVLWHKENPARVDAFDWRVSAYLLRVPVIQVLFEQLSAPSRLRALNLVEVLNWVGNVLNRVDRPEFFGHFDEGHAVQYFYEPFLEAFSPQLRKELGVWYTPPEVVTYMVERVDTILRQELGRPSGLADEDVYVLDPATGTAGYLVAVLRKIAATHAEQGNSGLAAARVKEAAMQRVFGFELLPAPFVIAHLQIGLLLQNLGAPLAAEERAGVYLTNALTGWQPPDHAKQRVLLPELAEERDRAEAIKQRAPILVVLGNPPYNGYAGVAMAEERDLSNAYRSSKKAPKPQGQGLNDLYVRFFRMAERAIVEMEPRQGVICFISNYSWLDGLSFPGMRERYLELFDHIWIDRLNGDKYKTGKVTPDGKPDPSIFSTEWNREGIQVGTAVTLLVRTGGGGTTELSFRDLWGSDKRAQLLATARQENNDLYQRVTPNLKLALAFTPSAAQSDYFQWPLLSELFLVSFPGVQTGRDDDLVDLDQAALVKRMAAYFDPAVSHEEMRRIAPRLLEPAARFEAVVARESLQKRGFLSKNIVRFFYRPFDVRWLYWEPETKLLDEKRADYFPHIRAGNLWLAACQKHRREFDPPVVTARLASRHVIERGANLFPLFLVESAGMPLLQFNEEATAANLSKMAQAYLGQLARSPQELFFHVIATVYAPAYRQENAGALQQDWPRIPLPATADLLATSAALGEQIARLLDPETAVVGVTGGTIWPELRLIGPAQRLDGRPLNPAADFNVTAGWGYTIRDGAATMPGQGRVVERGYTAAETAAIEQGAARLGLTAETVLALLGETTFDLYLNEMAYWQNLPANVWHYTIGGYQVLKKWLSYREQGVIGRPLTLKEVEELTHIARRLTALLLLQPHLDASYQASKASK